MKRRRSFDIAAARRRQIERHARHIGAAETEDFWRWPVAWSWHNGQSKDPVNALIGAVARMGGSCSAAEAEDLLEQAKAIHQRRKAGPLGKFLGVTYEHRRACGITTFGPRMPPPLRKEKDRMGQEKRRRARGACTREEYEANCLSRTRPWEAQGISRRTWERRRRERRLRAVASPSTATPTPTNDATPSTAISFLANDGVASAEPPQEAVRANAQPCGHGGITIGRHGVGKRGVRLSPQPLRDDKPAPGGGVVWSTPTLISVTDPVEVMAIQLACGYGRIPAQIRLPPRICQS